MLGTMLLIAAAAVALAAVPPKFSGIVTGLLLVGLLALAWRVRASRLVTAEMPKRFEGPYRIFSTANDRELYFDKLPAFLADQTPSPFPQASLADVLPEWVDAYEPAAHAAVKQMSGASDVAITLLLDHSGSLRRDDTSCLLAAMAGVASECLARAQITHEILAFTTTTWRGGESRKQWLANGAPPAPGRLCDLLHIIYRTSDETSPLAVEAMNQMTDVQLLKENIDGEALLWAANRLRQLPAARRALLVVSDGAPVDDSTILANGGNILDDHIRHVAGEIVRAGDVELYGVGLKHDMRRYYPQYCVVTAASDIGAVFLPMLAAIVTSDAHRPLSA